MQRTITILALAAACAGCASGPPEWVASPSVDSGFAATECVRDSGRLSSDRQVALGKARAGIARQFEQRVAAMDKAYASLKDPSAAARPGGATPFAIVARPIAEQMLAGLPPTRVEYVDIDDVRQLCAMIEVEEEQAKPVFERLLTASGEAVDPATHDALYREFSGGAAQ